jgi:predicted PhzF superfamily epimerase YddE/YHI9
MKLRQYQIDAFARRVFEGNPAAVCLLDHWLADEVLLAIAGGAVTGMTAEIVVEGQG